MDATCAHCGEPIPEGDPSVTSDAGDVYHAGRPERNDPVAYPDCYELAGRP